MVTAGSGPQPPFDLIQQDQLKIPERQVKVMQGKRHYYCLALLEIINN